jgi:hypothetical protein
MKKNKYNGNKKENKRRNGKEAKQRMNCTKQQKRYIKRACQIFCVIGKVSSERNPFFSKLNGELVKRQTPVLNRHGPFF